MNVNPFVKNKF